MATNKFLIFDEQGKDMMSDTDYSTASQRISGVVPGLADAEMHNKLYRQVSIMANAIGRVLGDYNLDAPDNDVVTLASNIKSLFCFNVLDAYPVGAIYISASAVSPGQLFGGTWQQISGRFLLAADSSHAAGSTGGEASHTLTTNEMPPHNHGASSASAGGHSHTVDANGDHTHTTSVAGAHSHSRGTMNITGRFLSCEQPSRDYTQGAFYHTGEWASQNGIGANGSDGRWFNYFDASRSWSGYTSSAGEHNHAIGSAGGHSHAINSNGAHTHTVTTNNTGGGAAHNNMPPYLSVYVWKRTA